jgi:hypothetical protein
MHTAGDLLKYNIDGVYKIKSNGEKLYNVLLEKYDKMVVNNLIVETLDPQNPIAQLYTTEYNDEERNYLINYWNNHIIGVK